MTLKTDTYQIGLDSVTDSKNYLLDTDITGALRIRRNSDGSGGIVAKISVDNIVTFPSQPAAAFSCVRLDGFNGYGSTNTRIPRFTNTRLNQGTDITYVDSPTLGASLTVNTSRNYSIAFTFSAGSSEGFCITLNESAGTLSSSAAIVAIAEILQFGDTPSASASSFVSWEGYLPAGSIIRPHTGGGVAISPRYMFTMSAS